ncbi:MAG: SdiA-regulated domain-containing protein, partial [Bacteroidota bacterium]|nr:SdiA-regulated domain-containing protein [Bacteroidota bacterium]
MKKLPVILLTLFTCFGLIFCDNASKAHDSNQDKGKKKKDKKAAVSSGVQILEKWDMPAVLKEVSGIAYLGPNRFACVQDEAGTVFIYNTANSKIEKEIPFGGSGDYEGITVTGKSAYVVSSNGTLYEIEDLEQDKPKVKTYSTSLTAEQNVEGLCYDKKGNRLL